MCGITGWVDWTADLTKQADTIEKMTETLEQRGPDASGTWLSRYCAFGHRRLCVMDPAGGAQPMVRPARGSDSHDCVLVYNGELYNAPELRKELESLGYRFRTTCDTEVLLQAYVEWGPDSVDKLNGIFAFAVWHTAEQKLFMARDRLGVKPLFYRREEGRLLFGSEPKAILAHPGVEAAIDAEGLAELFVIGPARTPGHGVWKDIYELKPGHCLLYDRNGMKQYAYWQLHSAEHEQNVEQTAEAVRELLADTVERQLVSDVPICTLLSGGLDSSALTALAVDYYKRTGQGQVHTFSVDYVDNDKHFQAHDFQPNADAPWIKRMNDYLSTVHHPKQFDTPELAGALDVAVLAKDLPGMADIDASLYLFCREIKKEATVAISGEAADEIFGGYPWFHREEALKAETFPWSLATDLRAGLLSPELRTKLRPREYLADRYAQAVAEVPHLPGEDEDRRRMRRMSYLNITRFMPTLLDRKDRMSMAVGLEVRVPYCDHRLVQYVFNIPWEIKTAGMREKGILRKSLEGVLPNDVLYRKKSPYPKTHNPNYLAAVRGRLLERLDDPSSPLLPLIDASRIRELAAASDASSHIPWFGQLMSGPQLFAYLLQVDFWLRHYKVKLVL
ncbi:asparagine synthase (glutamine-hydrolyzing) [Cohnella sp. CIP 111063]|mgnify:CR=1 FL=1|uniref:asparagine synthase (glutamine-hydrolyzing) n=1 Tax=unclassified Cohnella TaxID=2636738 RepID=UPI000B8C3FE3|nr:MULTISPECIES: asparagine synthase (glutamine-hydrolyzing) [unclassified Cohnella]OXS57905.1 asparagine synthase (glutamine-hydrolyzing) [Cohnella sp. CIP 111063]PRX71227.1 asparagine synthase (glutamine-hydrolysing) [Cohnella sp. SGD-V74]